MIERGIRLHRRRTRSAAAATGLLASLSLVGAASASPASVASVPRVTAAKSSDPAVPPATEVDASSRNTVARARMLECGHQWNNMKRAGTASGTWKDFSRGCLAQR